MLQVAEVLEVLGRVGLAAAWREVIFGFVTCLVFFCHADAFGLCNFLTTKTQHEEFFDRIYKINRIDV
jgi:hypothetical protein